MLIEIANRVLIVCFFMSILIIVRHAYYFTQAFLTSTEEEPVKYILPSVSLFYLGLSIAYLLASIFTGIKL